MEIKEPSLGNFLFYMYCNDISKWKNIDTKFII